MTVVCNPVRPSVPVGAFLAFGAIAALVAASAAASSLLLGFAPWAMFVGWVAWFTRPTSARQGAATWLCLVLGLALGAVAVLTLGQLMPRFGVAALGGTVFVVALIVVSMRAVRLLDNIPAWFLGLIAFFASHEAASLDAVTGLASASAIGVGGGWLSLSLQRRWTSHP